MTWPATKEKRREKRETQEGCAAKQRESMSNNPVEPEVDDGDRDDDNGSESSSGSEDGK